MLEKTISRGWDSSLCWLSLVILMSVTSVVNADTQEIDKELIKQEVRKELQRLIDKEGALDAAIERSIISFVEKQRALARSNQQRSSAEQAKNVRPVSNEDHIYGNPKAEITLVEYSDFECPFCKRFHPTAKQLVDQSDGAVNWVYRHFPLAFHNPGAQKQAEASECAGKLGGDEAFWRYSELIYDRTTSNGNGFPISKLVPLAEEIGLESDPFKQCLDDGEMASKVKADYENGVASGVSGTPGNIFLHNSSGDAVAMAGALPLARLQEAVNALSRKHADK
ncbi:DsbA family protein [Sedimenticola selenatireducens]|uniref:DsbA family protein n=1 Tax=Sedimenticola selenatireducens TaxID=191960 RepID=UPI001FE1447E|nr:DsbA family protein [Sedimenticola selenatireducens]